MLSWIQWIFLEVGHIGVRPSGCNMPRHIDLWLCHGGCVISSTWENIQVVIESRFVVVLNNAWLIDLFRSGRWTLMVRLLFIISSWITRHWFVSRCRWSWFVNSRSCFVRLTRTHGHRVSLQVMLHVFMIGWRLIKLSCAHTIVPILLCLLRHSQGILLLMFLGNNLLSRILMISASALVWAIHGRAVTHTCRWTRSIVWRGTTNLPVVVLRVMLRWVMLELWWHHVHIVSTLTALVLIATMALVRSTVDLPSVAALIAMIALLNTMASAGIIVDITINRNVLVLLSRPHLCLSSVLHRWLPGI